MPGPKLLRSLLPISVLPEAPWAVTANGKSWTPEDKETCTLWAAWGGPRSSDIWWQLISKATSPCTGNRATAPSTFLQETKPVYKLRGRSRRPQLHPASVNVTMHTDPRCGTLASHLASVSPERSSSHTQMMGLLALFLSCLFPSQNLPSSPHCLFYQIQTQFAFRGSHQIPPLPPNQPTLNVLSALPLPTYAVSSQWFLASKLAEGSLTHLTPTAFPQVICPSTMNGSLTPSCTSAPY